MSTTLNPQHAAIAFDQARKIWLDLWPHDETLREAFRRYDVQHCPDEETRLPIVASAADVEVDDLVLVVPNEGFRHDVLRALTGREAMQRSGAYVARVLAVTGKMIKVREAVVPTTSWGWPFSDLHQLGEAPHDGTPVRGLRFSTATRQIGRLGNLADLRGRLTQHPDFDAWGTAYEAAVKAEEIEREVRLAEVAALEARQGPRRDAVHRVNKIIGESLLRWNSYGEGSAEMELWLKGRRLRAYVAGLEALGELTRADYDEALENLTLLGF